MNHTWSNGFEKRQPRRMLEKKPQSGAALGGSGSVMQLPDIHEPPGSPGSLARPMVHSSSEPSLKRLRSLQAARVAAVVERQAEPTDLLIKRREYSKALRAYRSAAKIHDDGEFFFGSKGVEGFREFLIHKCGSLISGWKAMDQDVEGRVSFSEFCMACRNLGFQGNLKQLWAELDSNLNGYVSLSEVDAEVAQMIAKFKLALLRKYGDMVHAWMEGIDSKGAGKVKEEDFVTCVQRLGLEGQLDGHQLFKILVRKGSETLMLKEFDVLAYNRLLAGNYCAGEAKARPDYLSDLSRVIGEDLPEETEDAQSEPAGDGAKKWRAHLAAKDKSDAARARQMAPPEFRLGISDTDGLKKALALKYGSLLKAWREGLDIDARGRITFGDFTLAISRIGFHGKMQRLWDEFIQFGDERAAAAAETAARQTTAEDEGAAGNAHGAEGTAEGGNGGEKEEAREEAAPPPEAEEGKSPKAPKGQAQVAPESEKAKASGDDAKAEAPTKRTLLYFSDLDSEASAILAEMSAKLSAKYGNMMMAWVKGLDSAGSGFVKIEEFCSVLEGAGFAGDAAVLFHMLQPEKSRKCMTVKDFDTRVFFAISRGDLRMLGSAETDAANAKRRHEMDFYERQQCGFKIQLQKALELAKQDEFAKSCKMSKASAAPLDRNAEDFEQMCKRQYGSLVSAWRQCLDPDAHGKLALCQFSAALRKLGYPGEFKVLWQKYDGHKKGELTLRDIDPEGDELIYKFLQLVSKQWGTLEAALRFGCNKEPCEAIDETALTAICQKVAYPLSPKKLYKCLQPAPGKSLTIWDIDPLSARKMQRGESSHIVMPRTAASPSQAKATPPSSPSNGGDLRMQQRQKKEALDSRAKAKREAELQVGLQFLPQFQSCLKTKYGSTVAAWRSSLDPGSKGSISFGNFVIACEDCAFSGNVKALWKSLCGDKSYASFRDIDPETQGMLDSLREDLLSKSDSLVEAWILLDAENVGRVSEEELGQRCADQGIVIQNAKKLFQALRARISQKAIVLQDFKALLIGISDPEVRETIWAQQQEQGQKEQQLESSFARSVAERQATQQQEQRGQHEEQRGAQPLSDEALSSPTGDGSMLVSSPLGSPPGQMGKSSISMTSPSPKSRVVCDASKEKDKIIQDLDGLKRILISKYGSLFAAWRNLLDGDYNGIMTKADFANVCRELGIKAIGKLWIEFDPVGKGQVGLVDFDPETERVYKGLKQKLLEHGKTTKAAWREVMDPDRSNRCDEAMFEKGCEKLGLSFTPKEMFRLLQPEAGRVHLEYSDIFPDHDRNDNFPHGRPKQSGAPRIGGSPKSATDGGASPGCAAGAGASEE